MTTSEATIYQENTTKYKSLSFTQAKLLSQLTVPVEVEIGELELSVEDIIDLFPGEAFEFAFDPLSPLSLRIGGSEIAKAKFVLVESRLALEIISVKETGDEIGEYENLL